MKTLRNNLHIYVINGVLLSVLTNLISPFQNKYLERLGGTEFHMSLFNALPGLVAVLATLPGTWLMTRCVDKKRWIALITLISRIFILTMALAPFLPSGWRPLYFVLVTAVRNFPESVYTTAFQSFSGDLFPPRLRPGAITRRNWFSVPAQLIVTLIAGQVLSMLPAWGVPVMVVYQLFFVLAFLIGLAEVGVFMMFRTEAQACTPAGNFRGMIRDVLADRKFRVYMGTALVFYFAWQMGWPIFNVYQIITLGANESWLSIISIFSALGMLVGYNYWNKLIIRKGNTFVAWVTTLGMAANPILMAISPNLWVITALNLIIGFFTAGTVTVLLSGLLEATPDENRVVYVGVFNTFVNISLAVSPIVSHAVLTATNIYVTLWVVGAMRFIGSCAFLWYARREKRLAS